MTNEEAAPTTASKETLEAVAERLRFFFSDANIRQDFFIRKLLLSTTGEYPGQVPIEDLLRFNTIKQHTESPHVVVQACKELLADTLTVSEDGKAIGVVVPFTTSKMDENIPVTLYVSNLPVENKKYTVSTDDVRALFGEGIALVKFRFRRADEKEGEDDDITDLQPSSQQQETEDDNGKNNNNKQRNKGRRIPIGAALVEFKSAEYFERAAAMTVTVKDGVAVTPPTKPPLELGGQTLSVMLLREYIDSRKKNKTTSKRKSNTNGDDKEETKAEEAAAVVPAKTFALDWKPGCVVSIKGITGDNCDREAILEAVAKALDTTVQKIKEKQNIYVDYSRGQTDGAIRFSEAGDSVQILCDKLAAGEVTIAGNKVDSAVILEGEAETAYWDNFIAFKNKQLLLREQERSSRKNNHKRPRRN